MNRLAFNLIFYPLIIILGFLSISNNFLGTYGFYIFLTIWVLIPNFISNNVLWLNLGFEPKVKKKPFSYYTLNEVFGEKVGKRIVRILGISLIIIGLLMDFSVI